MTEPDTTVLVVDDDPQVRELFRAFLADEYDVEIAASADEAVERMGDHVDVVLLDRRMPGPAGEVVLQQFREYGYDQPIAMVTAVDPDFDVLGMGFDDYVVKPVDPDELRGLVETLLLRQQYDDVIREYFALVSKATALQASKSTAALQENAEYARTEDRLEEIKRQAHEALDAAIDAGKFDELFRESMRDEPAAF